MLVDCHAPPRLEPASLTELGAKVVRHPEQPVILETADDLFASMKSLLPTFVNVAAVRLPGTP
jgi:hypothetical protein